VIVIDDLISTGGTLARAAKACRDHGAAKVYAFAAHGLFVGDASDVIRQSDLTTTFVTDTVPPFRLAPDMIERQVHVVSAANLFAEAIRRCHDGGSITELLEGPA
jgi:ribose-phosphate pyrophosphokinase